MAAGTRAGHGAQIVAGAGLLGAIVSIVNYYSVSSGIQGTGGAQLVIASSLAILVLGFALMRLRGGWHGLASAVCLILLLGTAFAAYLLNSPTLLALTAIGGLGWLLHTFRARPAAI